MITLFSLTKVVWRVGAWQCGRVGVREEHTHAQTFVGEFDTPSLQVSTHPPTPNFAHHLKINPETQSTTSKDTVHFTTFTQYGVFYDNVRDFMVMKDWKTCEISLVDYSRTPRGHVVQLCCGSAWTYDIITLQWVAVRVQWWTVYQEHTFPGSHCWLIILGYAFFFN